MMNKHHHTFNGFGEAYFSLVQNGVIKRVKRHLRMALNLTVRLALLSSLLEMRTVETDPETIGSSAPFNCSK